MNEQQHQKIKSAPGFIAALDQSGGSTPKALSLYGIGRDAWSGEQQMFERRILMMALVRDRQRAMQGLFKALGKSRHSRPLWPPPS